MPPTPRRLLTPGRVVAGVAAALLVAALVSPLTGRADPAGTFRDYTRPETPPAACLPLADAFQLPVAPLLTRDAFVRGGDGGVRRVVTYQLFSDPGAAFASVRDHLASHGYAVLDGASASGRGVLEARFRSPDGGRIGLRVAPLEASPEVPVTAYARVEVPAATFVAGTGCPAPLRFAELVQGTL